jgi:hypothetical protein
MAGCPKSSRLSWGEHHRVVPAGRRAGARAYGLLYIYDDEDTTGLDNEFQVFRMVRGQVSMQKDPFLSPFMPTLEDPLHTADQAFEWQPRPWRQSV